MAFRRRRKFKFKKRRRYSFRKRIMRKAMSRRNPRPEIKYLEAEGKFGVIQGAVGSIAMMPLVIDNGPGKGQIIGNKIKTRFWKVRFQIYPGGDKDIGSIVIPIRVSVVQRRISDETEWNNYVNEIGTNNNFWNPNFARVLYDKEKFLSNPFDPDVKGDNFMFYFDKTYKLPMNIVYKQNSVQMDKTKQVYIFIFNRTVPTEEQNDILINWATRVSYIDN